MTTKHAYPRARRLARHGMAVLAASLAAGGVAMAQAAPGSIAPGSTAPGTAQAPLIVAPIAPATPPATSPAATAKAPITIRTIRVNVAPLAGAAINAAKWPALVQQFGSRQINVGGNPSVVAALGRSASGVNLQNSQANPYQPDIIYHGFTLSPIQGTPEGISVYVDGARFNVPFGDLALWSVLPQAAIAHISVEDANPLFGLNALGGALSVQMKNGFTYHRGEVELSGGSFGTLRGNGQYGISHGDTAAYIAVQGARSGGWRDLQSSALESAYADLGWRGPHAELHINAMFGHSFLNGPATVPAKLLAIAPNAEYTGPNSIEDTYSRVAATLNDQIDDHSSIQAVLYYDHLREHLINGNGPVDAQCTDGSTSHLCGLGSSNPATLLGGGTVPYFAVPSGFIGYGSLAVNSTNTDGYGATAQLSRKDVLFGLKNHLIAGASFDGGFTTFSATNFDGLLNAARVYAPPPGGGLGYQTDEPGALPSAENIRNAYYGLYASDSLDLTPRLTLTLGGRLNIAQIDLHNTEAASALAAGQVQNPADLSGHHNYEHFNPSLGFSYRLTPLASLYGSYSQANAAPTPAELTCANPTDPCTLSNFITFDPNLKQTVTDSLEAGIRGALLVGGNGTLTYNLDYYHIRANDDVEFLATNLNNNTNGYFANIGGVLRQGADLALRLDFPKWDAYFNDSLIEATYQSSFRVASHSPSNIGGVITVRPGDHLAGVPENLFKFGADYKATTAWKLGLSANAQTGTYLHGDQSNQQPKLPGFVVLNFTTSYRLTPRITLFGEVDNFTDAHYYVYGGFSNPAGIAYVLGPAYAADNRAYSTAAPIAGYAGVKVKF